MGFLARRIDRLISNGSSSLKCIRNYRHGPRLRQAQHRGHHHQLDPEELCAIPPQTHDSARTGAVRRSNTQRHSGRFICRLWKERQANLKAMLHGPGKIAGTFHGLRRRSVTPRRSPQNAGSPEWNGSAADVSASLPSFPRDPVPYHRRKVLKGASKCGSHQAAG